MITKFCTLDDAENTTVEFVRTNDDFIHIQVSDNSNQPYKSMDVIIDKDDLFNLIGQLLRIQSDIKKNNEFENLSNKF